MEGGRTGKSGSPSIHVGVTTMHKVEVETDPTNVAEEDSKLRVVSAAFHVPCSPL